MSDSRTLHVRSDHLHWQLWKYKSHRQMQPSVWQQALVHILLDVHLPNQFYRMPEVRDNSIPACCEVDKEKIKSKLKCFTCRKQAETHDEYFFISFFLRKSKEPLLFQGLCCRNWNSLWSQRYNTKPLVLIKSHKGNKNYKSCLELLTKPNNREQNSAWLKCMWGVTEHVLLTVMWTWMF